MTFARILIQKASSDLPQLAEMDPLGAGPKVLEEKIKSL